MNRLALITRHPIKAHGRELLASVVLSEGETLPFDRRWAVAHEAARLTPGWVSCNNFLRGVKTPQLMAMEAAMEGNRPTFVIKNEVQWWGAGPDGTVHEGIAMSDVIDGNLTKTEHARALAIGQSAGKG